MRNHLDSLLFTTSNDIMRRTLFIVLKDTTEIFERYNSVVEHSIQF